MAEVFPTEADLERAIKEAIPRDWFAFIDMTFATAEEVSVIRRGVRDGISRSAHPISYRIPGYEISPAVIQAFLAPKVKVIMAIIDRIRVGTRMATALDQDIDSFGWQIYGDLISRDLGESDETTRTKIGCLLRKSFNGEEFWFLPSPTRNGVEAFLDCFGYTIHIPTRTPQDDLAGAMYWDRPEKFAWDRTDVGGWNGGMLIFILDTGNPDLNEFAKALIRRAKVYGTSVENFITATAIF